MTLSITRSIGALVLSTALIQTPAVADGPAVNLELRPFGSSSSRTNVSMTGNVEPEGGDDAVDVTMRMNISADRDSFLLTDGSVSENWYITGFDAMFSVSNGKSGNFVLTKMNVPYLFMVRDSDGTLRSISVDMEPLWREARESGIADLANATPEPSIGDIIGFIGFRQFPPQPMKVGESFYPRTTSELQSFVRNEFLPAIEAGIREHGTSTYMTQLKEHAELIIRAKEIEWISDVSLVGTVLDDGRDSLHFSGSASLQIEESESNVVIEVEMAKIDIFIDPVTGQQTSNSTVGSFKVFVNGAPVINMQVSGFNDWGI